MARRGRVVFTVWCRRALSDASSHNHFSPPPLPHPPPSPSSLALPNANRVERLHPSTFSKECQSCRPIKYSERAGQRKMNHFNELSSP